MYQQKQQNSQQYTQDYRQGYSQANYYDSQSQLDISHQNRTGQSRYGSNKKIQLAEKINDVIEFCASERNDGTHEFESIANAEKGILDMLLGSDSQEVHLQGTTGNYQGGYGGTSAGLASGNPGQGGYGGFSNGYNTASRGFVGTTGGLTGTQKGNKPFEDMNAHSSGMNPGPSIRTQLNNNPKVVMGDDAIEMIQAIERKALLEIESLRRERVQLIRRLNQQTLLHNDQKRRRAWCQTELKKLMTFLEQQGLSVGAIQYPQWYFQSSVDPQQASQQQARQQQTYVIGGDQTTSQGFQTAQMRSTQGQHQQSHHHLESKAPSFAGQNQGLNYDPQQVYIPGQQPAGQVQGWQQSNMQYQQQQSLAQPNLEQQPNQASQQNLNQSTFNSQLVQSTQLRVRSPSAKQVQSTYQIGGNTPNAGYQQAGENYQDPNYPQQRQGFAYNPQTGQYFEVADNYGGLRNNLEQLKQENQNIRQNFNQMQNPDDLASLQQRLLATEQRARSYEREIDRWRLEASRKGDYPGLAELLEETERIRQETIKLLKIKSAMGGQRSTYEEELSYRPRNENYNSRIQKQAAKSSYDIGVLSPKQRLPSYA